MADIALLVAEEYERRMKFMNRSCSEKPREEERREIVLRPVDMGLVWNYVKAKIGEEKMKRGMEIAGKWVMELETKSPIGVAASNCFFSA
ncbi:hypothetical protein SAY87_024002 [Trapa incisa]|uniref:Uncharacterized protein n=1 Tax=Trapa incisa TaxID=236973 RepID=A0AAN7QSP2_9MYRT|nr:hypothetical protein SAY87_024002 [Trapa incisa]